MSQPKVGIVILNWNRLDLTKSCLESVKAQKYPNLTIIIVDNGSTDGSITWLEKQSYEVIFNSKNRGFAPAINQGFAYAVDNGCDYVVALNNDAVFESGWLHKMTSYMENHPDTGFAQGASMQHDDPKLYDSSGIYLEEGFIPNQRALGQKDPRLEIPVIGPNAAGAIYRRSMLEDVAIRSREYFDSRFFAYVEDVDLNLRCTLRGYGFDFVPTAKLRHVGSATGNKIAKKKMYWGARNLVWLVYKNASLYVLRRTYRSIIKSHLANLQYLWCEQRPNFLPYFLGLVVGIVRTPFFYIRRRNNLKRQKLSDEDFLKLLLPSNPPLWNPLRKLLNLLK